MLFLCLCSDDNWQSFLKRFATSVQHITGQQLEIKAASDGVAMSIFEEEVESLRTKVDELSEEVRGKYPLLYLL